MDNLLKELSSLSRYPNDSKIQLKRLTILKDILETLRKYQKKQITDSQQHIEDALYDIITHSKVTNDITARYVYYIYKFLNDHGLSSHVNDFIIKYTSILSSKTSQIIKNTALWLLAKVCTKSEYKTPTMSELIKNLLKFIKNNSDVTLKSSALGVIARLLNLKLPFFINQINDILKMIFKQEKYLIPSNKKNLIKLLDSLVFYLNQQSVEKNYSGLVEIIIKCFDDPDEKTRSIAKKTYISLHVEKVFESNIIKQKIVRKREGDQLKNFLEVLLYIGTVFNYSKSEISVNTKLCFLDIMCQLFIINKDYMNSSESLIIKVYDLMLSEFPLVVSCDEANLVVTSRRPSSTSVGAVGGQNSDVINKSMEKLYRTFIKTIYNVSYRKSLLTHIIKKIVDSQFDMDKIENSSSYSNGNSAVMRTSSNSSSNSSSSKKDKKFTEFQVNAMLMSLIEYTENNCDLFEQLYKNFQDLSNSISVYITSSLRVFRILITRILINLAYYLPSWRISILTLVLNMSSVTHAEVVSLRNTFIYFVDENNAEYKYSLIIKKNIDLLKDICNCLALILNMFSHKSHGLPVDTSLNALNRAKNIILGNYVDESDNPEPMPLSDIANNYTSIDLTAYKESGWLILQGLCSMDKDWLCDNANSFFFLWKYIFSNKSCAVHEHELRRNEYKDALACEFLIKKAALASLRKFILSCGDDFLESDTFKNFVEEIIPNIIKFFIPYEKELLINFYRKYLSSSYDEAKMFVYDFFYSIPINLYIKYFNSLLYPITDEIIYGGYIDKNYEHIYSCLNQLDNFMCNEHLELDKFEKEPEFIVDNFVVEKYNFKLTNLLSKSFQFVFSATKLFVEIMLNENLTVKNRVSIFKHLLSNMTEIAMKKISSNDVKNYNKCINISFAIYLVIKNACRLKKQIINDEEIFTNSKMIFDLCFKIEDNGLIRLIASEGHSFLINASTDVKKNVAYYLSENEVKFSNERALTQSDYINTFYLISNIFRNVNFKDIAPCLDNYMNFVISNFNKIEDIISNPFVPQSIFIIIDTLIKNDQIDYVRKLIEIYKMNFLFFNMTNSIFFKDIFTLGTLAEIRLLIIFTELNENIKSNEYEMFKMFLAKFLCDEKYRSQKIQKNFLLLTKVLLHSNSKLRDLVINENFIMFLFERKESFYEQKLSLEILSCLLISDFKLFEARKINIKPYVDSLVNYLNELYNKNHNFYFNHKIFTNNFYHINSSHLIYDTNHIEENQRAISSLIDFSNFSNHNFDVLYKNFHLIKLCKFIIRFYIEKNYLNVLLLLNMIKELVQNQLVLYSNDVQSKTKNSDSLKADNDSVASKTMTLITIRKLDFSMHLNLKKFLIKIIQNSLIQSLDLVLTNNKTSLIEVLNYFMSSSMVLVSCEESWEIRILGIELLIQIIKKFATVIDTRTEDNSLLIQQYEAQISSCIKIIFNNTVSIRSVYKGLKLIYMFITIPISTDTNYIKKVGHMVDLTNLKKNEFSISSGGADMTSFSERADHNLICKKLVFFCKLFLSLKTTNNMIVNAYDVLNSKVTQTEIYSKYITSEYRKSINDFFNENFDIMMSTLIKMLSDFYVVLTTPQSKAILYKEYYFIFNGNKIAFSENKLIKYGQIYLKVFSMMLNDKNASGKKISQKEITVVIKLIFYYINYYMIKSGTRNAEKEIYLEQNKISLSLDSVLMAELIDSFIKIINSSSASFTIEKSLFIELLSISVSLIQFGITELNFQVLVLIDALSKKYLGEIGNETSPEEKKNIISTITKILFYYLEKTSLVKGKENIAFMETNSAVLEFIVKHYHELKDMEDIKSLFYSSLNVLICNFRDFNGNNSKLCAGKIFNLLMLINDIEILHIFFKEIESCLSGMYEKFDKFFILFYMILQFISKCQKEELCEEGENAFIEKVVAKNLQNKSYMGVIIKSLVLSISQNFEGNVKKLVEKFIVFICEENYLVPYFTEDLEKIILTHIMGVGDESKRKEIEVIITLILVDNKEAFDQTKLCIFLLKLFNKDSSYLKEEEIQSIFDESVKTQINSMLEMQMKFLKEQEEKQKKEKEELERQRKLKEEEMKKVSQESSQRSTTPTRAGGPKIKALKFKK